MERERERERDVHMYLHIIRMPTIAPLRSCRAGISKDTVRKINVDFLFANNKSTIHLLC